MRPVTAMRHYIRAARAYYMPLYQNILATKKEGINDTFPLFINVQYDYGTMPFLKPMIEESARPRRPSKALSYHPQFS